MWFKNLRKLFQPSISRGYNLHEYQSLLLLKSFGVPTPFNKVAFTANEASDIAQKIGDKQVVVKAQVLAGGRGQGKFEPNGFQGGVHIISPDEVQAVADSMIGQTLVTKQTGTVGKPCDKVLVMKKLLLVKEFYLAILLDRKFGGPVLVYSKRGGMDIEHVAAVEPAEIHKIPISLGSPITAAITAQVASDLGFDQSPS